MVPLVMVILTAGINSKFNWVTYGVDKFFAKPSAVQFRLRGKNKSDMTEALSKLRLKTVLPII
jgi:hypothetical protein